MYEKIELDDGKYTLIHDNGGMTILRYGEVWRNEIGDKLILSLFQKIKELEEGK